MFYALLLTLQAVVIHLVWRFRFFRPLQSEPVATIRGVQVLMGFGCYLIFQIMLVPFLVNLILRSFFNSPFSFIKTDIEAQGWLQVGIVLGGIGAVAAVSYVLTSVQRKQLWNGANRSWIKHIGMGVLAWLISAPFILTLHEGLVFLLQVFFHHANIEQVVVQNMRQFLQFPFLFALLALSVSIFVPITEEFLFRGLLQSWLKKKLHSSTAAILIASALFASFHYSTLLGISNIALLSSLYLFSCMLGYIFERENSLWASIGLHGVFNFLNLTNLSFGFFWPLD